MAPTLEVGDYFFVSKSTYGYSQYSFPAGEMLPALADNRDNSNDSRFGVGFVPYANIVGQVVFKVDREGPTWVTQSVR